MKLIFADLEASYTVILTPKRQLLARKHVVWAIKCVNQCRRLTCRQNRQKRVKDSQKVLYFTIWRQLLAEQICPKICVWGDVPDAIMYTKFQGISILRRVEISIFLLIFEWLVVMIIGPKLIFGNNFHKNPFFVFSTKCTQLTSFRGRAGATRLDWRRVG